MAGKKENPFLEGGCDSIAIPTLVVHVHGLHELGHDGRLGLVAQAHHVRRRVVTRQRRQIDTRHRS